MDWIDKTFADVLHFAADRYGEQQAVIHEGNSLTYSQLLERTQAFARGLLEIGVKKGDHVALWMPDSLEWIVARWAVPYVGAILVPLNTRLRGKDLEFILKQSDTSVLIFQNRFSNFNYLETLSGALQSDISASSQGKIGGDKFPKLKRIIVVSDQSHYGMDAFSDIEASGAERLGQDTDLAEARSRVEAGDVAQILYTSGTTALPKGAMVCHGPLLQNNTASFQRMNLTKEDRFLASVPLFSATGTSYNLAITLVGGAIIILDRFSAENFCNKVEEHRISVTFFLDTIVQDLKHYPGIKNHDLSSLRTGTGAPLSAESFDYLAEKIGITQLTGVYGMSETSNAVCRTYFNDPVEVRRETSGSPVPGAEITIINTQTGEPAAVDEIGEIRVSGFMVMPGYYNRPDENAATFDEQNRLRTGDLGKFTSDGQMAYCGRLKDMIKPSGFNVSTQEIEGYLKAIPGISEAAVVGVPDQRLGEVAFAFIEIVDGKTLLPEDVIQHCRKEIASYKVPRYVRTINSWPRTSTGKIQKQQLQSQAEELVLSGKV